MNGFYEKIEEWWKCNKVNGKVSFRLLHKLSPIKSAIKKCCKEEEQRNNMNTQLLFQEIAFINDLEVEDAVPT